MLGSSASGGIGLIRGMMRRLVGASMGRLRRMCPWPRTFQIALPLAGLLYLVTAVQRWRRLEMLQEIYIGGEELLAG